jgi:methionyl-tRNA formyltransferase
LRTGFVTCVQLGADVLEEIISIGGSVDVVVTLQDDIAINKSGRAFVDDLAKRHAAELHKTRNINERSTVEWLEQQALDWLFIIGWSQIAERDVLDCTRHGAIGMHPTLLPQGRGRASIPWTILKRLGESGVTMFQLDDGVDTGPILAQVEFPIDQRENASSLYRKAVEAHRELIRSTWPHLLSDEIAAEPQDHAKASVWPARRPEDGQIRRDMTVEEAERLVRALAPPYPGARWKDERGHDWYIWAADTNSKHPGMPISLGDGELTATVFQRM